MSFDCQDWTVQKIYNKIYKPKQHQNEPGFKEKEKLFSDEIYQLNKITKQQSAALTSARIAKGLSQKDFAHSISRDISIIQDYENGTVTNFNKSFYNFLLIKLGVKP